MRGNGARTASSLDMSRSSSFSSSPPAFEHARRDTRRNLPAAACCRRVVKRHLRLDHPELGQMPPRLGFLGTKRRAERVDLSERRGGGFAVQLARLREVRVAFVEIFGGEESASLADRRRENRRVDAHESALVEEIVDRLLDFVPHARSHLARRSQPEMPMIEEEIDAVLLRLDRIFARARANHIRFVTPTRHRPAPASSARTSPSTSIDGLQGERAECCPALSPTIFSPPRIATCHFRRA